MINNGGYTIEVEIRDGTYDEMKNWNYTGLVDAIQNGEGKFWTKKVNVVLCYVFCEGLGVLICCHFRSPGNHTCSQEDDLIKAKRYFQDVFSRSNSILIKYGVTRFLIVREVAKRTCSECNNTFPHWRIQMRPLNNIEKILQDNGSVFEAQEYTNISRPRLAKSRIQGKTNQGCKKKTRDNCPQNTICGWDCAPTFF